FLRSGEPIYTIGHPEGWQQEYLSPGKFISTDTARDITGGHELDRQNPNHILLTTSQNIQGGDSGAPAFNNEGKVIGIVSRGDQGSHGYMVSV
ncbi:serine protease, partial [Acinetobacter baumannii]